PRPDSTRPPATAPPASAHHIIQRFASSPSQRRWTPRHAPLQLRPGVCRSRIVATRAPVGPAPSLPLYIRGSRANGLGLPKARGHPTAMCALLAAILAAASARGGRPLPVRAATPKASSQGG